MAEIERIPSHEWTAREWPQWAREALANSKDALDRGSWLSAMRHLERAFYNLKRCREHPFYTGERISEGGSE